jgi:hypothetical protein
VYLDGSYNVEAAVDDDGLVWRAGGVDSYSTALELWVWRLLALLWAAALAWLLREIVHEWPKFQARQNLKSRTTTEFHPLNMDL